MADASGEEEAPPEMATDTGGEGAVPPGQTPPQA